MLVCLTFYFNILTWQNIRVTLWGLTCLTPLVPLHLPAPALLGEPETERTVNTANCGSSTSITKLGFLLLLHQHQFSNKSFLRILLFWKFKSCTDNCLTALSGKQTADSLPLTDGLILLQHRRLPIEAHRADDVSHVGQDGLTLWDPQTLPLALLVPQVDLVRENVPPRLHLEGVVAGDQIVHSIFVWVWTSPHTQVDIWFHINV